MNPRALRTLAKLREVESFAAAAAELNQTLSAVSMQMKALEARLGAQLFDRAFRPPKLTPLGREVAARAAEIVRGQDAILALATPESELGGRYRIGFVLTASVRLLPQFLAECRRAAPAARFEVETGLSEHLQEQVIRGRLDAAVVTRGDRDPAGLVFRDLLREEIVLALPAGLADLPPERVAERLPFFHFMPKTGIGQLIARELAHCRYPPRDKITLDGVEAIVECVKMGIGYTALPRPDVERYAGEALSLHTFAATPLMRELSLVTLRDSPGEAVAHRLHDLLRTEVGSCGAHAPALAGSAPGAGPGARDTFS